jgi:hypothetical protein
MDTSKASADQNSARQFKCAVAGIGMKGTVYRSRPDSDGYKVVLSVAGSNEFSFDIIRVARLGYEVPDLTRNIVPGVQHLRFTAASVPGHASRLVQPVEDAFETGVTMCVEWHKETQQSTT